MMTISTPSSVRNTLSTAKKVKAQKQDKQAGKNTARNGGNFGNSHDRSSGYHLIAVGD